jgi:hypothetical protein
MKEVYESSKGLGMGMHTCNLSYAGGRIRRIMVQYLPQAQSMISYLKYKLESQRAGLIAQAVNSNPSTTKQGQQQTNKQTTKNQRTRDNFLASRELHINLCGTINFVPISVLFLQVEFWD